MITVITSLYKSEEYLPMFLRNVSKIHKELHTKEIIFEHIIIANDFSKIEQDLIQNSKLHFKVISIPRESLYASWNRGVELSQYQYITFWNVDDKRFIQPFIEIRKNLQRNINLFYFPFIYKRFIKIGPFSIPIKRYKVSPPDFEKNVFQKEMHLGPFFIFNKEICKEIGLFNPNFKIVGDFEFAIRAAKHFTLTRGFSVAGIFNSFGQGLSTKDENANIKELEMISHENNNLITS